MKRIPNYEVGFGLPPKRTRWVKGQSGNPKGRPRRKKSSIAELIEGALAHRIMVTERGRRKYRTVFHHILLMLWTKATQDQNKKALRVLYQFEAFAAKKATLRTLRVEGDPAAAYARMLRSEDQDQDAFEGIEQPITAAMSVREAARAYEKIIQDEKDECKKRENLKRRRYSSSW